MKHLLHIILSEFRRIFSDKGSILIMVIGVFMYSLFYAIPYEKEVTKNIPIGVLDSDNSSFSQEYIRNLNTTDYVEVVSRPLTFDDAKQEFFEDKIKAFIVIPKDFEKDLKTSKQATVSMYADSSYLLIYKQIATGTISTATAMGAKIEIEKLIKKGIPKQQAKLIKQPFEYIQIPLFNPSGGYASYIYPIVLILIMQQTLLVGAGLLGGTIREYDKTFCALPKQIPVIIFGRCTAYVILYMFYSIFLFLLYPLILNYPMVYNLIPLFLMLLVYFYSISFLSQVLLYFFRERETSLLVLVVTSLPMVFLPGFIWPKETIPEWLNFLSNFIPATNAISGLIKLNQMGASFWQIKFNFIWLSTLCVIYFTLACFSVKTFYKCNK